MKLAKISYALLAIFILLLSFRLYVYDLDTYEREFSKNNVYEKYNKTFTDEVSKNLINYFKSNEELGNYYSEREILHLEDVKQLIKNTMVLFYIILAISLLLFIYLTAKGYHNYLSKTLINGGTICISLIILLALYFFINFDASFIIFHKIFFRNDLWLLSNESLLVNIFTEKFFLHIFRKILTTSIILSLILIILGITIQKVYKSTSAKQ